MTVVVRMDEEHAAAIDVAIRALKAELAVVERWGGTAVGLTLLVDDLEEIRERYRQAVGDTYGDNTRHSLKVVQ